MKIKRQDPNRLIAGCIILFTMISGIFIGVYIQNKIDQNPVGRILLSRRIDSDQRNYEMLIMDGNGNNVQWLSEISGSPTWSLSGKWIAADCSQSSQHGGDSEGNMTRRGICIFDVNTIPNIRVFPLNGSNRRPVITSRIELPEQCSRDWPTLSISWSPDEENLAIVCRKADASDQNIVCILSLKGGTNCWGDSLGENVSQAVWSPREDLLALGGSGDYNSKIYLIHSNGTNPGYLADGWSPEWSLDGKKIAFIRLKTMGKDVVPLENGIATINKDGSDMKWLYLSKSSLEGFQKSLFLVFCPRICRLAWSPDGRYIAFVASSGDAYDFNLYRLDIKTGQITSLFDTAIIGNNILEPDWGP